MNRLNAWWHINWRPLAVMVIVIIIVGFTLAWASAIGADRMANL